MPSAQLVQNAFNGGEISPLSVGRTEIPTYKASVLRLENLIATLTGPVVRRMGTRFIAEVADSEKASRLIPFVFSNEQSYILEFSENKIRVFSPVGAGGFVLPSPQTFTTTDILLTGDTPSNAIRFQGPHYFADQAGPFHIETDDTLPDPLVANTDYYIIRKSANAIQLALTPGGTAIVIADVGVGDFTLNAQDTVIQEIATTYSESELFEIDFAQTSDVLYLAHPNHFPAKLERRGAASFRLVNIDFLDGPYDPINTATTEMNPADLNVETTIPRRFFEDYDVYDDGDTPANTFCIPNHGFHDGQGPMELIDYDGTSTLPTGLAIDDEYWVILIDEHTFQISDISATSAAVKTFSTRGIGRWFFAPFTDATKPVSFDHDGKIDYNGTDYDSRDFYRMVRYRAQFADTGEPHWAWGFSTEFDDETDMAVAWFRPAPSAFHDPDRIFRQGAFWGGSSGNFTNNYPSKVFFHEQRLWFAATPAAPLTIHASQTADFNNFAPDEGLLDITDNARVVTAASGLTYRLAANSQNAIQWLSAVRSLIVATTSNIWPMQGSSLLEPLTPTSVSARPSASIGSSSTKPALVGDEVIYSSRSHRKILAVGFNFERDSFVPDDLTVLTNHLMVSPIVQFSYTQEPHSVIWACRADGQLMGCTYDRQQRVLGWHRHFLGGSFESGPTQVESIASIQDTEDLYDQLWLIVKRTIGGDTKRYIEFITKEFELEDDIKDAHYVDSSPIEYDGVAVNMFSGLDHLDGELVDILADGIAYKDRMVTAGTVTLPDNREASKAVIGVHADAKLETLAIEAEGAPGGTLIAREKRIIDLFFRVVRTNSLRTGQVDPDGTERTDAVKFPAGPMDAPVPLFTGDIPIKPDVFWEKEAKILIVQDNPVPLHLVSIAGRVEWAERG